MLDYRLEPGAILAGEPIHTAKGLWQRARGAAPDQIQRARGAVRNELADVLARPEALATMKQKSAA